MLRKVYNESEVKNNVGLMVVFAKMHFKEFIGALNCSELCGKLTVIRKLTPKTSLKLLRGTSSYK
jgi:hypothetical protein